MFEYLSLDCKGAVLILTPLILPTDAGQIVEDPNVGFETDNRQMTNRIFGGIEVNPPYKYPFIAKLNVRNM